MKVHKEEFLILVLILVFSFFSFNKNAMAFLTTSLGGKIITSQQPGVMCGGYGPITVAPIGSVGPATPYYISFATPNFRPPTPGASFLWKNTTFPTLGLCYTTSVPPIPYTVFNVTVYGTSKF